MKNKKGIIITIIVLILLALLILGLVFGKGHKDDDNNTNNNTNTNTVNKTTNTTKDDNDEKPVDNGVSNQTAYTPAPVQVIDNSYNEALSAVNDAESKLDNTSLTNAQNLVNQVTDVKKKEELSKRLEEIKNAIEVSNLLDELEEKLGLSESKEDLDQARSYDEENNIADKIAELTNEDLKEQLQEKYEELSNLLKDNTPPEVNIEDGAILSEKTVVEITDDNDYTAELTKNGEVIDFTSGDELDEGTYSLTVVDDAFNEVSISFIVDTTAPIFNVEDNTIVNSNLNIVVDDLTLDKVSVHNDSTKEDSEEGASFTLDKDGIYTITAIDLTSRSTTINVIVDKTSPVLSVSYSTTDMTNQNVIVTLTTSEVVQGLDGWTNIDSLTYTKTYEANAEETVNVTDIAGNTASANIVINNIDKVVPEATVTYQPTDMTNENVTATLVASEEITPLDGWTSVDAVTYTKEYEGNANDTITITDLAGNTANVEIVIGNIDKEVPEVEVTYSTTDPTNSDVTVTITANEEIVELEGWNKVDEKTYTKVYSENTITEVTIDTETSEIIDYEEIVINDLVGNSTIINISVINIDREAPAIEVTYAPTDETNDSVTVTLTANEEIAELEGWTKANATTLTKVYAENTSEVISISDLAGNSTDVNIAISNIVVSSLTANVTYSTTEPTNEDVLVRITASEEIEPIVDWNIVDETTYVHIYTDNVEEDITVSSLNGETTTAHVEITNIDKTAPALEVTYSEETEPVEEVTVTITSDEPIDEVEGWNKVDDVTISNTYTENTTESVIVFDLVGNGTEVDIVIENIIETTEPTVPSNGD